MSKLMWFVIGAVCGELMGRWLMHIAYWAIIISLLIAQGHICAK